MTGRQERVEDVLHEILQAGGLTPKNVPGAAEFILEGLDRLTDDEARKRVHRMRELTAAVKRLNRAIHRAGEERDRVT